jgi:hypothetical protein
VGVALDHDGGCILQQEYPRWVLMVYTSARIAKVGVVMVLEWWMHTLARISKVGIDGVYGRLRMSVMDE